MQRSFESPLGRLLARVDDAGELTVLRFVSDGEETDDDADAGENAALDDVEAQLCAYFAGERLEFELSLAPAGTEFQQRVWRELANIPAGSTASYGELAARTASVARAVGSANGSNPIAIVVPCHRVIGADGTLTGYAGGLERKRWLLAHEAMHTADAGRLL